MSMADASATRRRRTVVITGASAGVGRALARLFASEHAAVGLIGRDAIALAQTADEVSELGGLALACPADIADAEAVHSAARLVETRLGPIDLWVNNAMVTVFSPLHAMSAEEFKRVTEVTYLGYVHGTMAALKPMRARNRGTIVQVGSGLAYRGIPLQSAYCGAKHAIRGFTDSLRCELLHEGSGLKLTMVHLPAVNTPQFDWARTHLPQQPRPVAPVIEVEAAANAIYRAARTAPPEIWVGFSTAKVIIGNMVAPRFLDRYLALHAYKGQQSSRPLSPERVDNLFEPVRGLHRGHGSFGREAAAKVASIPPGGVRMAAALTGVALAAWLVGLGGFHVRSRRRR